MKFRRTTLPGDIDLVQAITARAYTKWVPVIGRLPKPMTADYATAIRDHVIDLLVDESGTAVGLVELIPAQDHLLIENVAVEPQSQGQGAGRQLVAHAEEVARDLGLASVRLYTNKLFAANIQLYLHLGYQIDGEEEFRGGAIVHMSRRLV